jgi:hypothetical protein
MLIFNFRKIAFDTFVNKYTAIGHNKKEKHFFHRKIINFEPGDIFFIKTPNAFGCKIEIPYNINYCRQQHCRKKVFPFFIKSYFLIEA